MEGLDKRIVKTDKESKNKQYDSCNSSRARQNEEKNIQLGVNKAYNTLKRTFSTPELVKINRNNKLCKLTVKPRENKKEVTISLN